MIELLLGATPLPNNVLIETIKEPVVIEIKVEAPIIEEIKDPNGCEPLMYWASEAPYYCIPKTSSVVTARTTENKRETVKSGSYASSGYWPKGYCTTYVASRRPVGQWNDASLWRSQALADGWTVSANPVVGAIAWQSGHVAYVESVNDTTVTVSEMNYVGWNKVSSRTVPISTFSYIY